jgi:hypothetical protein
LSCTDKEKLFALLKNTKDDIDGKDMFMTFLGTEEDINEYPKLVKLVN